MKENQGMEIDEVAMVFFMQHETMVEVRMLRGLLEALRQRRIGAYAVKIRLRNTLKRMRKRLFRLNNALKSNRGAE